MINAEGRKYLVRVASTMPNGDGLRRAILAGLLRLAEEEEEVSGKGPGKDFIEYMKEVWDGGKKKVSNPNPKTRDSHPEVAVSTAMKDKKSTTYKQVMDGFKKWTEEKKKGGDDKKSDKPLPDQKKARRIEKKIFEQVRSHGQKGNGAFSEHKLWYEAIPLFFKKIEEQGAPYPDHKEVYLYPAKLPAFKKFAESIQKVLSISKTMKYDETTQDQIDDLESAFDEVKDNHRKARDEINNFKFPEDVIEKWKVKPKGYRKF